MSELRIENLSRKVPRAPIVPVPQPQRDSSSLGRCCRGSGCRRRPCRRPGSGLTGPGGRRRRRHRPPPLQRLPRTDQRQHGQVGLEDRGPARHHAGRRRPADRRRRHDRCLGVRLGDRSRTSRPSTCSTRSAWTSPRSATTSSTRAGPTSTTGSSTAARNAAWDYLGANVYAKGTTNPLLPEYMTYDIGGVTVGVIGAVTAGDHLAGQPGGHRRHRLRRPGRGRQPGGRRS